MIEVERMPFKICPTCNKIWLNRSVFLEDNHVHLIGYQAHFDNPLKGLFIFEHHVTGCGTSLAVKVKQFEALYHGPRYNELLFGSDACPGYCLEEDNFNLCHNHCSMAFVREVLYTLKQKEENLQQTG